MDIKQKSLIFLKASVATVSLLSAYFILVGLISGIKFALSQFSTYWYFLISLAVGFGVQMGLYLYLRYVVKNSNMKMGGKTVAVTGTTSTLAMISCCAHYLANIVPILGIAGAFAIVSQYQIQIFWVGLAFNLFGIGFIINKIEKFKEHHE